MSSRLQDAIEAINDILEANVPNVIKAYDYPVDQLFDERCVMTYYGGGEVMSETADWDRGLHNIICDFIVFRKDLARDMQLLMTDIDEIFDALVSDPTFGGTVSTYEQVSCSDPISSQWAGQPIMILRFTIENVKLLYTT